MAGKKHFTKKERLQLKHLLDQDTIVLRRKDAVKQKAELEHHHIEEKIKKDWSSTIWKKEKKENR